MVRPVLGSDHVEGGQLVLEPIADPSGEAAHDRDVVSQGQQPDRLVARRQPAEKRHEQPLLARVLVGDERRAPVGSQDLPQDRDGAPLRDDAHATCFAHAQQPVVEQWVVDRSGQREQRVIQHRQRVAQQFPVAAVTGDEDRRLIADEVVHGVLEVADANVLRPGALRDQPRHHHRVDHEDPEHVLD